jgi:HEAT repeat protein
MEAVIEASRASSEGPDAQAYRNLRSNAAFALGMIGGTEALDRLNVLLDDGDANTRYNAATGLARHGDARALPVILEMLDPKNTEGLDDPDAKTPEQVAMGQEWKRALVMTNGLRAAKQLVQKHSDADYAALKKSLATLKSAKVIERVKLDARQLELLLAQRADGKATK